MKSLCALAAAFFCLAPAGAATVPVRFPEGVTHGYLELRSVDGKLLASGDLRQNQKNGEVAKRMWFRFKDGSVYDETVTFTQKDIFVLKTYHLVKRGPAFEDDSEISVNRATGEYKVTTKDHKGGKEDVDEGKMDMPEDVYNGLILTVVKDLPNGRGETVHFLAFTPKPRLIELELVPVGKEKMTVGDRAESAMHYVLKPRLGAWLKLFAKLTGRDPEDMHAWIDTDEMPAFVGYEGALSPPGPVWRIDTVCPRRADPKSK
jgi:hypothetical protein